VAPISAVPKNSGVLLFVVNPDVWESIVTKVTESNVTSCVLDTALSFPAISCEPPDGIVAEMSPSVVEVAVNVKVTSSVVDIEPESIVPPEIVISPSVRPDTGSVNVTVNGIGDELVAGAAVEDTVGTGEMESRVSWINTDVSLSDSSVAVATIV
jgi:hypothetical protein